jgi:S-adenosylmethionine/arginine decarboxylase-like enzyme
MNKFVPFHQHLLVKCYVKNPPRSVESKNKWFVDLVSSVEMQVVAGPTSVYVNEPGNEGLTGTVTLATSHSSIHIWDAESPSLIQFDLYSCKPFSISSVIERFDEWVIVKGEYMVIDRNDGLVVQDLHPISGK